MRWYQKQRELFDSIKNFSIVQEQFLSKIQEWYEGGAGTIADVWQTQSRLAMIQSSMATIESQLGIATDSFVRLFGFVPEILDIPPSIDQLIPNSMEQALEIGAYSHPVIKENQLKLEASDAALGASRAGLWPSIRLALESNYSDNVSGQQGETKTTSAMIRMSYNFFRGGRDLALSEEAMRLKEQTMAEVEIAEQTLQKNIEKSWRTLQELRKRLAFLDNHVSISKQVVGAYYEQFFADKRTLLNVLNAEQELFTAESNRLGGYYALLTEQYQFLANMGILDEALQEAAIIEPSKKQITLPEVVTPSVKQTPPLVQPSTLPTKKSPILGALLTRSASIRLYSAPQKQGTFIKELPPHTPLQILATQKEWFQVVDPGKNSVWIMGPVSADGEENPEWTVGIVILDPSLK